MYPRFSSAVLHRLAGVSLVAAVACRTPAPAPLPPVVPPTPVPPTAAPPPVPPAATATPASVSRSQPDCVGPFTTEGDAVQLALGSRKATVRGSVLEVLEPDADRQVTFGLIANLKEPTDENLSNLARYVAFFRESNAEAILVAGDSGKSKDDIRGVLTPLAKTGLPVFVIPGNWETRDDFNGALDELSSAHPNVVNMSKVRLVKFDDASIVSLPGYYDRRFIHAGDAGCQYFPEDVAALAPIVAAAAPPAILLAHAEPLGEGGGAIDWFGDGNAGDPHVKEFLAAHPVPFGVFANIHEAGGSATDHEGHVVRAGEAKERLYLNVGLADSTPWRLNDRTWSYGMAAVLRVDSGKASYETFLAPQILVGDELYDVPVTSDADE